MSTRVNNPLSFVHPTAESPWGTYISQVDRVDMDEAFRRLRDQARRTQRKISDVAREVIVHAERSRITRRRPVE